MSNRTLPQRDSSRAKKYHDETSIDPARRAFSLDNKIAYPDYVILRESDQTTLLIALWGALTGTVAVCMQAIQHFSDRAKLEVQASMSQRIDRATPIARLSVDVKVCNHGRRPLAIEHIGIILPDKPNDDPKVLATRTHAPLFDADSQGQALRLGEGDRQPFRYDFFPQKYARALWEKGKTARVFVRLTNGKEHFATFYLINPSAFPPEPPPK